MAISIDSGPARPPGPTQSPFVGLVMKVVTGALVVGPAVALAIAIPLLWGNVVHLRDVIVGAVLFVITGFGISVGYHRLFTHRSFVPKRWLKIVLAAVGSFAMEGSLSGWVAAHRRHHVYSDGPGDPHSPHGHGPERGGQLRGLVHAHVGWLFTAELTSAEQYAPDVLRDDDTRIISGWFPLFAVVSLAGPFFIGWGVSGTIGGALSMLLWAGLVRMMLLHHVTWSVNSICHMFGSQPASTKDHSTNFAPLAILSFGESWHNFHHAHPACARHGALRHQLDPSAALIRLFERAGWVTRVRWPSEAQLAGCAG
ncbi:MAG TPA: acyl-CoA desaturase [Acidimicrobiia bacterium]|nr:acyl-CoA desaturase [Acidimicrobiia bacterium]